MVELVLGIVGGFIVGLVVGLTIAYICWGRSGLMF